MFELVLRDHTGLVLCAVLLTTGLVRGITAATEPEGSGKEVPGQVTAMMHDEVMCISKPVGH